MPARTLIELLREGRPRVVRPWLPRRSVGHAPLPAATAWTTLGQPRCTSQAAASSAKQQGGPSRLGPPAASWTWSEDDLVAAEKEVALRKAAFRQEDFQELRALRERARELHERVRREFPEVSLPVYY